MKWIIALGATLPFGLFLYVVAFQKNILITKGIANFFLSIPLVFYIGLAVLNYYEIISRNAANRLLSLLFEVNGTLLLIFIVYVSISALLVFKKSMQRINFTDYSRIFFVMIVCGEALFIWLYSPFIAVRHLLPIYPFILFLAIPILNNTSVYSRAAFFSLTFLLGIYIGVSDWHYADSNRKVVSLINADLAHYPKKEIQIWHTGHWGWQWYASKNGYKQYHRNVSQPSKGDLLLKPKMIHQQQIVNVSLKKIKEYKIPDNLYTLLSTGPWPSYYCLDYEPMPWRFRNGPLAIVELFEVQ